MNTPRKSAKHLRLRRGLRGENLLQAALMELADTASWQSEHEHLTWFSLARRLGVSRQAVATKPAIQDAYVAAQDRLQRAALDTSNPQAVVRRSLEDRVTHLQAEIERFERERDGWIERWVAAEHNCRLHGYDPDKVFAPLDKPLRQDPRGRSAPRSD